MGFDTPEVPAVNETSIFRSNWQCMRKAAKPCHLSRVSSLTLGCCFLYDKVSNKKASGTWALQTRVCNFSWHLTESGDKAWPLSVELNEAGQSFREIVQGQSSVLTGWREIVQGQSSVLTGWLAAQKISASWNLALPHSILLRSFTCPIYTWSAPDHYTFVLDPWVVSQLFYIYS